MTSTDICCIIKACGEHGVVCFEHGDMKIDFTPKEETAPEIAKQDVVEYDNREQPEEYDDSDDYTIEDEMDNDLFADPEAWDAKAKKFAEDN